MLISSKNKNRKIVLGLMSYTYEDCQNSMSECQTLIDEIVSNQDLDVFLYKHDEVDNYIGIMVVEYNRQEIVDEKVMTIGIQRIGVIPSFKEDDIEYLMYKSLREKFPNSTIIAAMQLSDQIATWNERYDQDLNG